MTSRAVRVICRFRFEIPLDQQTGKDDIFEDWTFQPNTNTVSLKSDDKSFTFNGLLIPESTQEETYELVGKNLINDYMNGFNATIFAYGQSGSGKTFSMVGPDEINDQLSLDFEQIPPKLQDLFGIIPRATLQIFQTINMYIKENYEYQVSCSYIEIYMEEIRCLLSLKDKLKIKEYPDGLIDIEGKEKMITKTPEDIFKVIATGTKNKTVGATKQNERSSRSHTLLIIETYSKSIEGQQKKSKLNLIDLAGSEKSRNSQSTGQRAKEGIKINLSLSSLNLVFMALTSSGDRKYIPFKDSKLTRLLKDSLASKKLRFKDDTISTLGFAQRAKRIKCEVVQNLEMSPLEYKYLTEALKNEVLTLRGDLYKSNVPIHVVTDEKLLPIIPNNLMNTAMDPNNRKSFLMSNELVQDNVNPLVYPKVDTKKNIGFRKYNSILNLEEDEIIMKYCELRAKYENLKECAGQKISELKTKNYTKSWVPQVLQTEEDKEFNEKSKKIISNYEDKINEINLKTEKDGNENREKITSLNSEIEKLKEENKKLKEENSTNSSEIKSLNEQNVFLQSDIDHLNEKKEKSKNKRKALVEENNRLKEELTKVTSKVDELIKKFEMSESSDSGHKETHSANVCKFKIDELKIKNDEIQFELILRQNSENTLKAKVEELTKEIDVKVDEGRKKIEELKEKFEEEKKIELVVIKNDNADLNAVIQKKDIEIKKLNDKISALMLEMNGLKSRNTKLYIENNKLDLELVIKRRDTKVMEREIKTIKNKVHIEKDSNIFGVILKKTEGTVNKFLQDAKSESKKTEDKLNEVWKDKIDELKKLRKNIENMSPKTVSSRSTPEENLMDINFDDEEAFKDLQHKLELRNLQHEEMKDKLQKIKDDEELNEDLKQMSDRVEKMDK